MEFEIVRRATSEAEKSLLYEDWAKDPLTRIAWLSQKIPSAIIGFPLIIADVIISIPRMLLWMTPGINWVFIGLNQGIYWLLYGPVLVTSWLWREIPLPLGYLVRPLLIPMGAPFAIAGSVHSSLFLMGGLDEHGINKFYKSSLFDSWPLTVSMPKEVRERATYWQSQVYGQSPPDTDSAAGGEE